MIMDTFPARFLCVNNIPKDLTLGLSSGKCCLKSYSHGLMFDQPLTIKQILNSAFSNPDRTKYPHYPNQKSWGSDYSFFEEPQSAEYFLTRLKPNIIDLFDSQRIRLYDSSQLNQPDYPKTEPESYLSMIKNSRWYGPYRQNPYNIYIFITILEDANNGTCVQLRLDLHHQKVQYVYLWHCFFQFLIQPSNFFKSE